MSHLVIVWRLWPEDYDGTLKPLILGLIVGVIFFIYDKIEQFNK